MSRVIGISSGKGGVGKTTCTVNLGAALASLGQSVAIVDASLTTPDISLHLGIPFHMHSLSHVLQGNSHIHAATFNHKSGVRIIPGNIHVDLLQEFEGDNFRQVIRDLSDNHDFILVDCAAGLGRETISALRHCKEAIIVTNPDLPSVVNAAKTIRVCKGNSCTPLGVILNKTSSKQALSKEKIVPLFNGTKILGDIPDHRAFKESLQASEILFLQHADSKPAQKFLSLAEDILGQRNNTHVTIIPAPNENTNASKTKKNGISMKRRSEVRVKTPIRINRESTVNQKLRRNQKPGMNQKPKGRQEPGMNQKQKGRQKAKLSIRSGSKRVSSVGRGITPTMEIPVTVPKKYIKKSRVKRKTKRTPPQIALDKRIQSKIPTSKSKQQDRKNKQTHKNQPKKSKQYKKVVAVKKLKPKRTSTKKSPAKLSITKRIYAIFGR